MNMDDYVVPAKLLLKGLFSKCGEGNIHGFEHAEKVLRNALQALGSLECNSRDELSSRNRNSILLAALLHDSDDVKVFPDSKNNSNAREILNAIEYPYIEDVIEMIDLVSFRDNGVNVVYNGVVLEYWKFIPRDADRIEALGTIGVARCIGYGSSCGRPLYDKETPRLTNVRDIHTYTINSSCGTRTTIEYFIKHLIPRSVMSSGLCYFTSQVPALLEPIYKVIICYGDNGYLNKDILLNIVGDDPIGRDMLLLCKELS